MNESDKMGQKIAVDRVTPDDYESELDGTI